MIFQSQQVKSSLYPLLFKLANNDLEKMWPGERPAVSVGDWTIDIALKEGKKREPDACSPAPLVDARVSQRVVVQEQACGQIESHKHIDGVVLMASKDEEDAKQIQHPGHSVNKVPASWSVLSNEEVEHGKDHCVPTEHVISTAVHSSQSHSKAGPDG